MTSDCCGGSRFDSGDAGVRRTYSFVLEHFRRFGTAPSVAEVSVEIQGGEDDARANLRALESTGAVRLDQATGGILDAYPYSAAPTRHIVRFEDGSTVFCMCAIDVFYVPFLTNSDVYAESRCFYCDSSISLRVRSGVIEDAEPATTVVWDSAATYDCPFTNFFCSEDHLLCWRDKTPGEPGRQIDLLAALERGKVAAQRIRHELAGR